MALGYQSQTDGFEAVVTLIDWYRARWEIEIFFHVLKNGLSGGSPAN
ncbi:MAG: transposase [Candidatus Accumulibacter sp.]|nr:transposase [Accumulibacter sp.]